MKKLLIILFLNMAFVSIAMEQPQPASAVINGKSVEVSPEQIEQNARIEVILRGPQAGLHHLNSLIWAYMHPKKNQFSEEGFKFPHFKHDFVTYSVKWDDAVGQLQKFKTESKDETESIHDFAVNLLEKSPSFRFTLAQKLIIQKKFLRAFENNEDSALCAQQEIIKVNRANYKRAFNLCNWQALSALAAERLHCYAHGSTDSMCEAIELERTTAALAVVLKAKQQQQQMAGVVGLLVVARLAAGSVQRAPGSSNQGNQGSKCTLI